MKNVGFTVCSCSYLHLALGLKETWQQHCPEAPFYICLLDQAGLEILDVVGKYVLTLSDIPSGEIDELILRYTPFELCCALKTKFAQLLFDQFSEIENLIYCDSDLCVYADITVLPGDLGGFSIAMAPHLLSVERWEYGRVDPIENLRSGIYNAGFLMFHRCEETSKFLRWMNEILRENCFSRKEEGLFVDQKWWDYVPTLFPKAKILRHKGINCAYWNLHERSISFQNGQWYVADGIRLQVFHFSGFSAENASIVSRFMPIRTFEFGDDVSLLFNQYAQLIRRQALACSSSPTVSIEESHTQALRAHFENYGLTGKLARYAASGAFWLSQKFLGLSKRLRKAGGE